MSKIKYSLELTDSWYKIRAIIDQPLQRAILKSKIRIGYKLEICGVKIECKSTGISVLEALSSKIRLKLSNWDAKLGIRKFHPYALLRSLSSDGGFVHAINIIIQRKYPLFFRESMKDGTVVVRDVKNEERARKEQELLIVTNFKVLLQVKNNLEAFEFSQNMNSKQIERLHDYMQRKEQKKASKMNQWISEQLES
ncbi:1668_t:CDS:2 [Diversispora eburnea]|uniref:1668_t:CDS:1 n=1 Tax=Diversispora eburnea TaxID=1213867 RepID=A0A9N8W862_9GLOM|nr:1668_t:CDS:2 [Diversispora eburnea]